MKNRLTESKSDCSFHPSPYLSLPQIPPEEFHFVLAKKVIIFKYFAVSDGCRRVYTDEDALAVYGEQKILSPHEVSYTNLFINGVLQPNCNYSVQKGKLILKSEDIPLCKVPIVLQMIKIE
ncbi:MAG: DUF4183 domain-containing protein [Bacillus sp. (in: firmicutes)]